MRQYEFLEHTADIKFKAWGETLGEAFESAVLALASFIGKDEKIMHRRGKTVNVKGKDREELLYNFLEEIIYLIDSEGFVTAKANVNILGNTLKAELFGDDASNYEGLEHVKAPTYAEMYVKEKAGKGWELQVVMDV
jgi:SHS2 domain-containing protein